MNSSSASNPSFLPAQPKPAPAQALLVLDASGIVLSASEASGAFWQTTPASLVGQPVANLFVFEVSSQEDDWTEIQWEALLASALNRSLSIQAQPFESNPFHALLEIQPAHGEPASYFAQVRLASRSFRRSPQPHRPQPSRLPSVGKAVPTFSPPTARSASLISI